MKAQKIKEMFVIQEDMNVLIDSNWMKSRNDYGIAAIIEAAEMIDHLQWKWWKKEENEIEQSYIESIDIHHFLMSMLLIKIEDKDKVYDEISNIVPSDVYEFDIKDIIAKTKSMIKLICEDTEKSIIEAIGINITISYMLGGDFDKFYKTYVGKNVLNKFRQDNGYNDGAYIKIWNGKEDNMHLESLLEGDVNYLEIYDGLEKAYRENT